MISNWKVGDKVVVTEDSWQIMYNSNRSVVTAGYPSDSFLAKLKERIGESGTCTMRFPPGYEFNLTFEDGKVFHMKDNWVERLCEKCKDSHCDGHGHYRL